MRAGRAHHVQPLIILLLVPSIHGRLAVSGARGNSLELLQNRTHDRAGELIVVHLTVVRARWSLTPNRGHGAGARQRTTRTLSGVAVVVIRRTLSGVAGAGTLARSTAARRCAEHLLQPLTTRTHIGGPKLAITEGSNRDSHGNGSECARRPRE